MKKIINIVYAFSKTDKTFKSIVTAKNYDQLLPIMERNRDKASWFVYNIKDKTIKDMYAQHNPGKIAFFRELVGKIETRKSIVYAHGVTKDKNECTKKFLDARFKQNLDYVTKNTPKHKLYAPITDPKAVIEDLRKPFTDVLAVSKYMKERRKFTQQLIKLQDETIDITILQHKGFQLKSGNRQKKELQHY